jgi:hypothetical protein
LQLPLTNAVLNIDAFRAINRTDERNVLHTQPLHSHHAHRLPDPVATAHAEVPNRARVAALAWRYSVRAFGTQMSRADRQLGARRNERFQRPQANADRRFRARPSGCCQCRYCAGRREKCGSGRLDLAGAVSIRGFGDPFVDELVSFGAFLVGVPRPPRDHSSGDAVVSEGRVFIVASAVAALAAEAIKAHIPRAVNFSSWVRPFSRSGGPPRPGLGAIGDA